MSIELIIAHEDNTILDAEFFIQELRRRWPDASVQKIIDPTSNSQLQFETPDNFWVLGDFLGVGVSYRGRSRIEDAGFAVWYRSVVPSHIELQLYDSELTFDLVKLRSDTTQEELLEAFTSPFSSNSK